MPKIFGGWTEEERQGISAWLTRHLGKRECAVCGERNRFAVDPTPVRLSGEPGLPTVFVHPLVVVTCSNCAHVLLFHAGHIEAQAQAAGEQESYGG